MLRKLLIAVPTMLVIAAPAQALATPSSASLAPVVTAPATQGIIMSDGRICNPRWGC